MTNMISISINACVDADSPAGRAILLALGASHTVLPVIAAAAPVAAAAAPVAAPVARAKPPAKPPEVFAAVAQLPVPVVEAPIVSAVVTEADLRAAMKATIDAVGYTVVEQVFTKIGAKKMSDIRTHNYASAIAALAKAREVAQ